MDTGEVPSTIAGGHGTPNGVSAPFVRVFSSSTGEDFVDELRSIAVADPSSGRRLFQVGVKLLVPSAWRASVAHVVTAFPGLTLYTLPRGDHEAVLLMIGPLQEIEACANALS